MRGRYVAAMTLAGFMLWAPGAGALTVSNPPPLGGKHFTVRVTGAKGRVSLYLSSGRKLGRGAISIGSGKPRHGLVRIKVGAKVAPGGYYVLACTGPRREPKCGASRKPTVVLPPIPAVAPSGTNGTATPATTGGTTATIGSAGGAITVKAADGTKFTLAIDKDSVPDGTQVTMTPLAALSGIRGKLVGGVSITPDGLALVRGGVLVVQPAHRMPLAGRHAVAFSGSGQGIHTIPLVPQRSPIAMPVGALGGYALMNAAGARAAAARGHGVPASADEQPPGWAAVYEPMLTGFLNQLIASGHNFGDGSDATAAFQAAVKATLDEWYADILRTEIPAGLHDDTAAETAMKDLSRWSVDGASGLGDGHVSISGVVYREVRYTGMQAIYGPNWQEDKVLSVDRRLIGAAYNRAQQKCADTHDLSLIAKIIDWYHSAWLAGQPDNQPFDALYACEQFTATFDSTMTDAPTDAGTSGQTVEEYTASVRIKPDATLTHVSGSSRGAYPQAAGEIDIPGFCGADDQHYTGKATEQSGNPTTFQVVDFTPSTRIGVSPVLTIDTNIPSEAYLIHVDTTACAAALTEQIPQWFGDFSHAHDAALVKDTDSTYMLNLDSGTGATFGSKTYDSTFHNTGYGGNYTVTEHTTVTVTHTPGSFNKL
jgi:hypothetical protein